MENKTSDVSADRPPKQKERHMDSTELSLVIDKESGLPLCALLQAVYNPTGHSLPFYIPSEVWQLDPPAMPMLVSGTHTQWRSVVPRMIEKAAARKAPSDPSGTEKHLAVSDSTK